MKTIRITLITLAIMTMSIMAILKLECKLRPEEIKNKKESFNPLTQS